MLPGLTTMRAESMRVNFLDFDAAGRSGAGNPLTKLAVRQAIAYAMPLFYLGWSLVYGRRALANPWGATGLEWQAASPPIKENFVVTPVITGPPYDYPRPELVGRHV